MSDVPRLIWNSPSTHYAVVVVIFRDSDADGHVVHLGASVDGPRNHGSILTRRPRTCWFGTDGAGAVPLARMQLMATARYSREDISGGAFIGPLAVDGTRRGKYHALHPCRSRLGEHYAGPDAVDVGVFS